MPLSKELVTIEATRRLRYRTRMIVPGETFQASPGDARLLIAVKKAKNADRVVGEIAPPPKAVAEKFKAFDPDGNGEPGGSTKPAPDPELPTVRAEYFEKIGRRPFPGWDVAELRRRMAEAS
jgi:hypothetical protein